MERDRLLAMGRTKPLVLLLASCTAAPPIDHPDAPTRATAPASEPTVAGSQLVTTAEVRRILDDRIGAQEDQYGIVVGLLDANGPRVAAHGHFSKDDPSQVDGDTLFQIDSLTKVFTGVLLAEAVHRGDVRLEDPVAKFLPASVRIPSTGAREITLVDLATHTSGLPSTATNMSPADEHNPYADYGPEQLYTYLKTAALEHEAGATFEYSNLGMGLLGYALALSSGHSSYDDALRKRVLEPLNMPSTMVNLPSVSQRRLAPGHTRTLEAAPRWGFDVLAGQGGLVSSANDLLTFLSAVVQDDATVLGPALKRSTEGRRSVEEGMSVGLGWIITTKHERTVVGHTGGSDGYQSFMGFEPATGNAVVVLINLQTPRSAMNLGWHLLVPEEPLLPQSSALVAPELRQEIIVPAKVVERYVGQYRLTAQRVVTISLEKGQLYFELSGLKKIPIYAESETKFFQKQTDGQISFDLDESGHVVAATLYQYGGQKRIPRISE